MAWQSAVTLRPNQGAGARTPVVEDGHEVRGGGGQRGSSLPVGAEKGRGELGGDDE
jgi:hypothetical protein